MVESGSMNARPMSLPKTIQPPTQRFLAGAILVALPMLGCAHAERPERPAYQVPDRFADLADHGTPVLEFPGKEAIEVRNEDVVARFELATPPTSPFVLHGTMPIPEGVFPRPDGRSPFRVVSHDEARTRVPAQVEIVSRYPTGSADVVEILALVELGPKDAQGRRVHFDVVADPCDAAPGPATPESVRELSVAGGPEPVLIRTEDVFGNVYAVDLGGLEGAPGFGSARTLKNGVAVRTRRTYGTLVPLSESGARGTERGGDPLPHMMGVHAYVTEWAGDERISLDLRLNNGATPGSREPTREELPLGIVYWKSVELVLPEGWTALPFVRDPFFGEPYEEDGRTVVPLVRPNKDGRLHMMPPQAQFHRRLTLVPKVAAGSRTSHAFIDGLAFCEPGPALWSWFSPHTARYFAQNGILATWGKFRRGDFRGKVGLAGRLNEEFEKLRDLVRSGQSDGGNVRARVMGWAHPWYIKVQGGVGGVGIQIYAGHRVAAAASARGFARRMLLHRMNASRQPDTQYDRFGDAVGYHSWLDSVGRIPFDFRTNGRVVPASFKLPMYHGPPPSAHVREVDLEGLRPAYDLGTAAAPNGELTNRDENIFAWMPHDGQHMVRYMKGPQALVWLGNDALARDDMLHTAELFHLMFHESPHKAASWSEGVTLRVLEKHVAQYPHQGAGIGRDQAWGFDAMAAAYSVASEEWRERNYRWFERVGSALVSAAMPNGIIQRKDQKKFLGHEQYQAAQSYECLFILHGMRCIAESVLRGRNPRLQSELEGVYLRALEYLYWAPLYSRDRARYQPQGIEEPLVTCGPRWAFAVGRRDGYVEPPFSDAARWGPNYLPPDGTHGGVEFFHCWSALEYGMLITEPKFGSGLENKYLRRTLDCWKTFPNWRALMELQFTEAAKPSSDNSGNWAGFVGRLQALGQ